MNELDDLLHHVVRVFQRYTIMPSDHYYTALALYVAYTHLAEAFDFAPRLVITSAEKRSGKTRVMELLIKLTRDPLVAANASTPALFRSLENIRTVALDEADTIFGTRVKAEQNEDLRGLINAGFQRNGQVLRVVGPHHEVKEFYTFSPVILAAIGQLPDTISDRAVNLRLRRKKPSEQVAQYRSRLHDPDLQELQQALSEVLSEMIEQASTIYPDTPLMDRAADVWEPLLVVAELATGDWPDLARQAAIYITETAGEDDTVSERLELLADCKRIWDDMIQGDFVKSHQLLDLLRGLEDSRWSIDISSRRLADMLKQYSIRPGRDSTGSSRGYKRAAFEDAFERYLSISVVEVSEPSESVKSVDNSRENDNLAKCQSDTSKRQTSVKCQTDSPAAKRELTGSDTSDTYMQQLRSSGTSKGWSAEHIFEQKSDPGYCKGCGGPLPCQRQHTQNEEARLKKHKIYELEMQ